MEHLKLSDLRNPRGVTGILHDNAKIGYITADTDQGWQEYPGSWELWQKLKDGRLLRVGRWLKRAILVTYVVDGVAIME